MSDLKPKHICVECHHHILREPASRAPDRNQHRCQASPLTKTIDPVTGEEGYAHYNDFGDLLVTQEPYALCREINHTGFCPIRLAEEDKAAAGQKATKGPA
jgi:hypothetical protein